MLTLSTPSETTSLDMASRRQAIELLRAGVPVAQIAREVGVSRQTVQGWKAIVIRQGAAALLAKPLRGRPPHLGVKQRGDVTRLLLEGPARHGQRTDRWTLKGAALAIERATGVEFGATHVWRLLSDLGLETQHGHAGGRAQFAGPYPPAPSSPTSTKTGVALISAISRSMSIMSLLCKNFPGLTANELIVKLDMEKSVVSRILGTLEADGYVARSSDDRYSPSLRLLGLATPYLERVGLYELCLPRLRALAQRSGESVMLAVVQGDGMVYLAKAEGPDNVRVVPPVGDTVLLHASSVGKVWLASLSEDRALQLAVRAGLRAVTPATITTIEALRQELARVRDSEYATVHDELILGASSVGVPVIDDVTGAVAGALVIIAPTFRMSADKIVPFASLLREAAPDFANIARLHQHQTLSNGPPAL